MYRVGVVGGSGLTGAELMRLVHGHPALELAWATGDSQAGARVADLYPSLAPAMGESVFQQWDADLAGSVDLVFLALPHGQSQRIVPQLYDSGPLVVDLAADFRLTDPEEYSEWYGEPHQAPQLLGKLAYGLPELNRAAIAASRGVAAAGCYPTAAAIAIAPLVEAGLVEASPVIVDAASGVSGAGRSLKLASHFTVANENFNAYGVASHRHTPEMEQVTGAQILFTPHLAPMTRGILATCYLRPADDLDTSQLMDHLANAYSGERFVTLTTSPPSTKATWGSNSVHLNAVVDRRTGWAVVMAAIDNLIKGASGQAVQCANILLGLDEGSGLSEAGIYP